MHVLSIYHKELSKPVLYETFIEALKVADKPSKAIN